MKYEIRQRYSGKVLFSLETKSLRLCLEAAVKSRANLSGADLSGADLYRANLSGADLFGADLSGADLSEANLSRVKGINYFRCTPLSFLKDQIGKIRAYKLVTQDYTGPYYRTITYKIGEEISVKGVCKDESLQCAEGISLATLDWCMKGWKKGYKILVAEFTAKDIAAIPIATDGKFRVSKCKIIREKDLKKLGLEKE